MIESKFTQTDCWLLFSIGFGNKAVSLKDIISTSDLLNHAIMNYDEFVNGTNHLLVNDYIVVENGSFKTTKKAHEFYKAHKISIEGCIAEWIRFSKILEKEHFQEPDTTVVLVTEEEFQKAIDEYIQGFGKSILNTIENYFAKKKHKH